ncbi:porin [Marinospirillum sp. MEB164]|uniref:Porin n=1 Tax=Marinospirillum alkalitolerans TaxID=3123374 RepID=A0ABW8PT93_9GAMM
MMKKTLLASAIATSLVAGSAQAVTLFQNDSLRFDHYGRIQLQLKNDDGDNEIQNNGSRFGFRVTHTINDNLTAFGRAEFRFEADERRRGRNTGDDRIFNDLRNTYIGLQGGWGKVTVGNFDGIYFSAVSSVLDLFEEDGYRALVEGGDRARGDTLAFETADLGGLRLGLAARHYANVGANNDDEEWNLQAYVQYTGIDNLTLALAVDQNNEDTGAGLVNDGNEYDPVIGLSATYRLDALTASVLLETSGESRSAGLGLSYNYGQGDIYAAATWHDSWVVVKDGDVEVSSSGQESGIDFGLGANYKFTSNFRAYAEIARGNEDNSKIGDQTNFTVGARLSW